MGTDSAEQAIAMAAELVYPALMPVAALEQEFVLARGETAHALQGADLLADVGGDGVLEGAAGDREQHVHRDGAVRDLHGLDHAEVGDGSAQLGVDDPVERPADLVHNAPTAKKGIDFPIT